MTVEEVIKKTVDSTVKKLKNNGMICPDKTSYQKTEDILRRYPNLRTDSPKLKMIKDALNEISDDPYFEVIQHIYFDKIPREEVAFLFNTSPRTITRNKKRLVEELRDRLFPDDYLDEMFE